MIKIIYQKALVLLLLAFTTIIVISCSNKKTSAHEPTALPARGNEVVERAILPSDLMTNCKQWKITFPDGTGAKYLCDYPSNEYFYVNAQKNGIVFKTPIRASNGTTPNSKFIRSELRERTPDGKEDIYWTTQDTSIVYVKQAITHLPLVKNHLVATQIHGNKSQGIDDAMVLRLDGEHLYLCFNGEKLRSNVTIKRDYKLGTVHEVIFKVVDDKHYCYYSEDGKLKAAFENGTADAYLIKDGKWPYVMDKYYGEAYFKIGNYTQSNTAREGNKSDDLMNYGEVVVFDMYARH